MVVSNLNVDVVLATIMSTFVLKNGQTQLCIFSYILFLMIIDFVMNKIASRKVKHKMVLDKPESLQQGLFAYCEP